MLMPKILVAGTLLLLLFAGGAWYLSEGTGPSAAQPRSATSLPNGRALPEFSLTDHRGRPFTRERLRGQTSLVFFGFTHCPDICPATLQQLAAARRRLADAAPQAGNPAATAPPEILLISVDPERDTPEILKRYVSHFGEGVTGVTGDLADLEALAGALGIFFEKSGSGDDYTVNHSTAVLVIDRDAELQAIFSTPHTVDAFVHDLPLLMAAQ
jgi:protein SCO1/2